MHLQRLPLWLPPVRLEQLFVGLAQLFVGLAQLVVVAAKVLGVSNFRQRVFLFLLLIF